MRRASKRLRGRPVAGLASVVALSALMLVGWVPLAVSQQGGGGMNQPSVSNELLVKFAAGVSHANAEETIRRAGGETIGAPTLEGRLFHVRIVDASRLAATKSALEGSPGVEYVEPVQTVTIQPKN